MYFLSVGGYPKQLAFWQFWHSGKLTLHDLTASEVQRMAVLMEKYHDTPMDLADASLVAVAESRALPQIWTLDSDFYIYRLAHGSILEILK